MNKTVYRAKVEGTLTPPSSKSYAQRVFAAALLSRGRTTLHNVEFCSDTLSALRCITSLGAKVEPLHGDSLLIDGGLKSVSPRLEVGESGLSTRLFTPIASLLSSPIRIEGRASLLKRPMDMMVAPLEALGVEVKHHGRYLPMEVKGPLHGGEIEIDGSLSSQFITGLLLALPLAENDTTLHVRNAVSTPYLDMTIDAAEQFGVEIDRRGYEEFYIAGRQEYTPQEYTIEGDWSAAAMMMVAGAVGGKVTLTHLNPLSKQADTLISNALMRAGATIISERNSVTVMARQLTGFEFDATHCPDLFPALVALAASCEGESRIRGVHRLIYKESDRSRALVEEFKKLGIDIETEGDWMRIQGGEIHSAKVDSWQDHRIAMALAVAGLNSDHHVEITGAECVQKSYPYFFDDLEKITLNQ